MNKDPVKPGRTGEKGTNPGNCFLLEEAAKLMSYYSYLFGLQWVLEMQG